MTPCHTLRLGGLLVLVLMSTVSSLARQQVHVEKVLVHFLATSTLIRGTWGWNEDTYLAQILRPKENEAVLVRLVDAYPNEFPSLSREALTSESGTILQVRRDSGCDLPFTHILLRTAPGDPIAIIPERLVYQPKMTTTPAPDSVLPCYKVMRK